MNRIDLPTICGHELFIEMEEEIDANGVKKARLLPQSSNPKCKECRGIINQFAHILKHKCDRNGVMIEGSMFENIRCN